MKVNSYQRLAEHDLYAIATVARDVQRKMLIEVNPDMHKGNAYLKLYNAASKQKANRKQAKLLVFLCMNLFT